MILCHDAMPVALDLGCVVSLCSPTSGAEMARGRGSRTQDDRTPDLRVTPINSDTVEYVALSADGEAFLALIAEESGPVVCKDCGHHNAHDNDAFCDNCGYDLTWGHS